MCGHQWPVVLIPMRADLVVRALKLACCPNCAETDKIDVADVPEPRQGKRDDEGK